MTYDKKKYENDVWSTYGKFPSFLSRIYSFQNINGRIVNKIEFNFASMIDIDVTDKCDIGGCPFALCDSCSHFAGVDWNEVFEKYIIPELNKEPFRWIERGR